MSCCSSAAHALPARAAPRARPRAPCRAPLAPTPQPPFPPTPLAPSHAPNRSRTHSARPRAHPLALRLCCSSPCCYLCCSGRLLQIRVLLLRVAAPDPCPAAPGCCSSSVSCCSSSKLLLSCGRHPTGLHICGTCPRILTASSPNRGIVPGSSRQESSALTTQPTGRTGMRGVMGLFNFHVPPIL